MNKSLKEHDVERKEELAKSRKIDIYPTAKVRTHSGNSPLSDISVFNTSQNNPFENNHLSRTNNNKRANTDKNNSLVPSKN